MISLYFKILFDVYFTRTTVGGGHLEHGIAGIIMHKRLILSRTTRQDSYDYACGGGDDDGQNYDAFLADGICWNLF
jgi:hypothetical protein